MSDLEVIRKLFHRDSEVKPDFGLGHSVLRLIESNAQDSSVTLKNIPKDIYTVKLDSCFHNDNIFAGESGECSRCDFVIFFIEANKLNIMYVELKQSGGDAHKIKDQLKGGSVFVKYCAEIIKTFLKENDIMGDYKEHFVAFGNTQSATKRATQYGKTDNKNNSPDKFLKVSFPNPKGIPFRSLLAQ